MHKSDLDRKSLKMNKGTSHSSEVDQPFYVRRKPDPIPFSKYLYNSEKGTVLGRTGMSWGKNRVEQCLLSGEESVIERTPKTRLNTNTKTGQVWCVLCSVKA